MCGIAGFAISNSVHDPAHGHDVLKRMGERIKHRGPDGVGYFVDDDIALVHRRLAIIDIDRGAQPMTDSSGRFTIAFNGEIYNYKELRAELVSRGCRFRTNSDTEVLLYSYAIYGPAILNRLRGMFAFVVWDADERRLFGARDIFGIKPLYYWYNDKEFVFASEIKAFLEHPGFQPEVNRALIPEYLSYEYIPYDETLFKGVRKLLPAHYFEWSATTGELRVRRYHLMGYHIDDSLSLEEWAERIDDVLDDSVQSHCVADVEVGTFLSSGVDSGYVTERIRSHDSDVRTFSIGYEEESFSELRPAKALANYLRVRNYSDKINAQEFFDAMPSIQYFMDEPLPNPSANPLYFLARKASEQVKVVLSGEGADELFGGYPNYLQEDHVARYERRIPFAVRKAAALAARMTPSFTGRNFLIRGGMEPWRRNSRANYVFEPEERQRFLADPIISDIPQAYSRKYFNEVAGFDGVSALQFADMHTWLPYDILLKADRMSMAHSLELRVPYLDREVLDVALSLPARFRASHNRSKIALRHAASRHIPSEAATREKLGFPSPLAEWLRQDEYYERVKTAFESNAANDFFVQKELLSLLDEHRSGATSNMQKIWSFYSFLVWHNAFFEADFNKSVSY